MGRAIGVLAVVCLVAASAGAADKERYGLMGRIEGYDAEKQTVTVKVVEVGGGFAKQVGKKPPRDVRPGSTHVFSVQPEGSVLSRTVIRTQTGSALDRTASREGFVAALQSLPDDRLMGISISPSGKDEPAYKVMMIQIPYTMEEIMKRLDEVSVEE